MLNDITRSENYVYIKSGAHVCNVAMHIPDEEEIVRPKICCMRSQEASFTCNDFTQQPRAHEAKPFLTNNTLMK